MQNVGNLVDFYKTKCRHILDMKGGETDDSKC